MNRVSDILKERGQQHGDYKLQCDIAEQIKRALHGGVVECQSHLSNDKRHSLDLIATKLSRIVTGDPSHEDHWRDIEGYARLVADDLAGRPRPAPAPSIPDTHGS